MPSDLTGVDISEAWARYLRAVYEIEPADQRPETLLNEMLEVRTWVAGARPKLDDLIQISPAPLPDRDKFLADWIAFLRGQPGEERRHMAAGGRPTGARHGRAGGAGSWRGEAAAAGLSGLVHRIGAGGQAPRKCWPRPMKRSTCCQPSCPSTPPSPITCAPRPRSWTSRRCCVRAGGRHSRPSQAWRGCSIYGRARARATIAQR